MTPALHPYPAYKPSGIEWLGDVPENWKVNRLKVHLLLIDSGVWGDDFHEEGAMVLRSTEQTVDGGWSISNPARIRLPRAEQDAASLEENDLVITKSSGSKAHIGKTSLVTSSIAAMNCCFSNFMQRIRLDAHVNPLLIWYLFNSSTGREQLVFKSTSTTGLGNLNGEIIANCYFTFPPLDEQSAIVRYLDYVDRRVRRYVEAKRKLIALLEEERQAVIHQAVTRGLDPNVPLKPSGVEWLGDIPAHWEVRRLRTVGEALIGLTYSPRDIVDEENGVLVLRASNILEGRMVYRDNVFLRCAVPDRLVTRVGDILICSRSGSRSLIGKNAKIDAKSSGKTFGVFMTIFRSKHSSYLYYVFNSRLFDYLSGAFLTSTINQLTLGVLNSIEIPFPPTREKEALVKHLDDATANIEAAIARARRQIELVEEYRTRLIADVVTGKLDVRAAAARLPDEEDEREPKAIDSSPAGAGGALVPAGALE